MDCEQLSEELERLSGKEIELYNQLKELADNDEAQMGVGLILLWPTLFFLEGGDGPQAAEYSCIRGQEDNVEKIMVRMKCSKSLLKAKRERDARRNIAKRLKNWMT